MIDPKKINLNVFPKKLVEGALGSRNKHIFVFALTAGESIDVYAALPGTMKSIVVWMSNEIALYEKEYGEIQMPTAIESPFQFPGSQNSSQDPKNGKK